MTGRTIPVTRTDGSEVASEATQALIKAKTDNLDIALSALRDALRGTGNKTLTDLWDELASTLAVSDSASHTALASILAALGPLATDAKLEAVRALLAGTLNVSGPLTDTQLRAAAVAISAAALPLPSGAATDAKLETVRALLAGTLAVSASSLPLPSGAATSANQTTANTSLSNIDSGIGGASAAAAADTGASTTNGFLRWLRDRFKAFTGQQTSASSLSVTGASDGYFIVGGATADGSTPAAGTYSVRVGGQDSSGNKRTLLLKSGGELPTYSPALTITENWNAALTSSYQKVATTTAATKMLRMSAACNATAYDIEFQVVTAGAAAPSATGMALLAGDDFPLGIPIGDIYARSASLQKLIVWSA